MSNININLRLRPVRFAFLAQPTDPEKVLEIFRVNTCLWGGKFNPIIPFFDKLPNWWSKKPRSSETAKKVINGYLDFFEPDFIVESEKGMSKNFDFDPKRVLQLANILECDVENTNNTYSYGQSVSDLYNYLYIKEFRFKRHYTPKFICVKTNEAKFKNFIACNFGDFPEQKQLQYFKNHYKEIFKPSVIQLDAITLKNCYSSMDISALYVDYDTYLVNYHSSFLGPVLFILDIENSNDLIDFWNLRTIHQHILAIPIQWIKEMSPFCKEFILKNYRLIPGNLNRVMSQSVSLFSRSINAKSIEVIHKKYLQVDKREANCLQSWYPPIWKKSSTTENRPTLEVARKRINLTLDINNPNIQFSPLAPNFANSYGNRFRWANVIELDSQNNKHPIATIFPCNYRKDSSVQFTTNSEPFLSTTEGLVIFSDHKAFAEHWTLMDGMTATSEWLQSNKIKAKPSPAGRISQQIIQTLDFDGRRLLADKNIVKLLNTMSRKMIKSMHFKQFENEVGNAVTNNRLRPRYITFKTLVRNKVVELGMEIKCGKCNSWNWYSLQRLDYSLVCDLCLKSFKFPVVNPTNSKHSRWAYRIIGPFALPNYAEGGYAVALSIRFFTDIIGKSYHIGVTWSPGQELELPTNQKMEIDFTLWVQRLWDGAHYPTDIVFGEAKSFSSFQMEDINKMKQLAEIFPGAILVFATMREADNLSEEEIKVIRELAEWGREYNREEECTQAPVVILTGTELFAKEHLVYKVWKEKKEHEQIFKSFKRFNLHNLRYLANYTQQIYLEMPSYEDWLMRKHKNLF